MTIFVATTNTGTVGDSDRTRLDAAIEGYTDRAPRGRDQRGRGHPGAGGRCRQLGVRERPQLHAHLADRRYRLGHPRRRAGEGADPAARSPDPGGRRPGRAAASQSGRTAPHPARRGLRGGGPAARARRRPRLGRDRSIGRLVQHGADRRLRRGDRAGQDAGEGHQRHLRQPRSTE